MISFNWSIQAYNASSKEWFYPSCIFEINSRLKNKIINPRYKFSLNTLRFDWWNYNFTHSTYSLNKSPNKSVSVFNSIFL